MKKLLAYLAVLLIALTPLVAFPAKADAAIGGARIGGFRPRVSPRPRLNTPRPSAGVRNNRPNQNYKPSQKASDIPSAAPNPGINGAANPSNPLHNNSGWGRVFRSAGLLAGGMLLGSLLSNFFGFGLNGFMASVFGLLVNIAIVYALCCIVKFIFGKLFNRNKDKGYAADRTNPYRTNDRQVAGSDFGPIIDIKPSKKSSRFSEKSSPVASERAARDYGPAVGLGRDYEARRTADYYRGL